MTSACCSIFVVGLQPPYAQIGFSVFIIGMCDITAKNGVPCKELRIQYTYINGAFKEKKEKTSLIVHVGLNPLQHPHYSANDNSCDQAPLARNYHPGSRIGICG